MCVSEADGGGRKPERGERARASETDRPPVARHIVGEDKTPWPARTHRRIERQPHSPRPAQLADPSPAREPPTASRSRGCLRHLRAAGFPEAPVWRAPTWDVKFSTLESSARSEALRPSHGQRPARREAALREVLAGDLQSRGHAETGQHHRGQHHFPQAAAQVRDCPAWVGGGALGENVSWACCWRIEYPFVVSPVAGARAWGGRVFGMDGWKGIETFPSPAGLRENGSFF